MSELQDVAEAQAEYSAPNVRPCFAFLGSSGVTLTNNPEIDVVTAFRESLKETERLARDFTDYLKTTQWLNLWDKWECIAQSIIALRHIEDARMRFGEFIRHAGNWESCYNK